MPSHLMLLSTCRRARPVAREGHQLGALQPGATACQPLDADNAPGNSAQAGAALCEAKRRLTNQAGCVDVARCKRRCCHPGNDVRGAGGKGAEPVCNLEALQLVVVARRLAVVLWRTLTPTKAAATCCAASKQGWPGKSLLCGACAGLREGHEPYRHLATQAALAFLATGSPHIVKAAPRLVQPLRYGMQTYEPHLFGHAVHMLRK
eukprot:365326-Chlamydomonas_euryale.AAC.11